MTREERLELSALSHEYHVMEERVAALEEKRDKLREALRRFSPHEIGFRESMDHSRYWNAWQNARKALQEAEG